VVASGFCDGGGSVEGSEQQRLFEGEAGEISPPEPRLYLGTSGWSYADWEGSVYTPGMPPASRLAEYARRYASVEIDSTFYGTPRRSTVERWREVAPEGFLFAAKFPQEITHENHLSGCEEQTRSFLEVMALLGEKLGPLLLQLPPDFDARNMETMEAFLAGLPEGFRYAVEVRHRSWLEAGLPELLRERGAALVLVDSPGMPRLEEATAPFVYVRWLGDRREFPSGHTHLKRERDEDLRWWSEQVSRFLKEERTVFAYANNHYQNHSPTTLERFLQVRAGAR
jgi:uncharacterized protein YecE (DUF72 family)